MPTIERDGAALWYETLGNEEAPPVLLLHDAGSDLRAWMPAAQRLAGDYWLILPDLRGHGLSSGEPLASTPGAATYLADIDAVLAGLGVELCAVAGLGFGALLALRMAIEAPDRVAAVVVAGHLDGLLAHDEAETRDGAALAIGKYGATAYGRRLAATVRDAYLAAGVAALYQDVQTEGALDAMAAMRAARLEAADLIRLRTPVMVASGERGASGTAGDRLAAACAGTWRVRFRDAGDDAPSTHAAAFADQVARFFAAVEEGAPVEKQATV